MASIAAAILLALAGSAALAGRVLAHANLLRTDPPDGIVLALAPGDIHLWFSEPVAAGQSSFSLVDADHHVVRLDQARVVDGDGTELVVRLPPLTANTFRLDWRAVSADDLHVSSGSIVFGVAGAAAVEPTAERGAQPAEVVVGWLGFVALAGLIGALVVALLMGGGATDAAGAAGRDGPVPRMRRRLRLLALVSAVSGAIVGVGSLVERAAAVGGTGGAAPSLPAILGSSFGLRGLATIAILSVVATWVAWRGRRTSSVPVRPGHDAPAFHGNGFGVQIAAVAGLGLVLATLHTLNSHVAAVATDPPGLGVDAGVAHVLAAAVWIGGLAALVVGPAPLLVADAESRAIALAGFRRFGWLAALCLAIMVVTGLVLAGALVPSVDALLVAGYGHMLLLKVGLAGLVALVGLANAASLHPSIVGRVRSIGRDPARRAAPARDGAADPGDRADRGLRRRVIVEAVGALAVAGLAATLAATPPTPQTEWTPVSAAAPLESVSGVAQDLIVSVSIRPNRPGRNFVTVGVYDTRRPALAPVERVLARLGFADPGSTATLPVLALTPAGDGRYEAGVELESAAPLAVAVVAERPGLADAVFSTPWEVQAAGDPSQARPVLVSRLPMRPVLVRLAAVLALAFACLFAAAAIRDRRRTTRPGTVALRQPPASS